MESDMNDYSAISAVCQEEGCGADYGSGEYCEHHPEPKPEINNPDGQVFDIHYLYTEHNLDIEAIWGDDETNLWAEAEPLYICAASGVGKTTIALQLIAARCGLTEEFLGHPVKRTASKVLYIGADRPRQLYRMIKTMFTEQETAIMSEDLAIMLGFPKDGLKFDVDPDLLVQLAEQWGPVDTIVLDSAKDFSMSLTSEEGGAAFNEACQRATREGINVIVLHHERKSGSDESASSAPTLDKIYGSHNLTSGAGSVIALKKVPDTDKQPGDIMMYQVKSAAGEMPPARLKHNDSRRTERVMPDMEAAALELIRESGFVTVTGLADIYVVGSRSPTRAERTRAQRKLEKMRSQGLLSKRLSSKGENEYIPKG